MGRTKQRTPRVLVFRCDECGKLVGRSGYLSCNPISAKRHRETIGGLESVAPMPLWKILHAWCDPTSNAPDYRIAVERLSTTGDLLEATADLMRNQPWVAETNWPGLIRRVLADTRLMADPARPAKRRGGVEDEDDESTESEGPEYD